VAADGGNGRLKQERRALGDGVVDATTLDLMDLPEDAF
jgi:hypothetical protein